jgi:hypothetical protein
MKKAILTAFASLFFCAAALAQNTTDISGTVKSKEEALVSATVVLLSEKDSSLINFSLSNNDGFFRISSVPNGSYLLQITYLGFDQFSSEIEAEGIPLELGEIILEPSSATLETVEIKGERVPLMVNRDTLEYNAAAFQSQPNEVVEDLLKRLPGIEVESDGNIKAQGEDVQQVLVDGKRFFGDDPKVATRNLPADAVKKVQVYDQKSDKAEFSGVDDGERIKTINLDLKVDRKSGAFGNATVGYGTDERYKGTMSINRFSSRAQLSVIGNFNNVNEQGFSVNDYVNFMSGMGWGRGRSSLPVFNGLSNGFVETHAGGINLNYDLTEKTELSLSYFINSISNTIASTTTRENYADEADIFFTNEASQQDNNNVNHRVNFDLDQEIDSTQNVRLRGSVIFNRGELNANSFSEIVEASELKANSTDASLLTEGNNTRISLNGTYRKKFGKINKRIFTLSGAYNDAVDETMGDLASDNIIFGDSNMVMLQELLIQNQLSEDDQRDYRVELSYVEPLGNDKYVELKYTRRNYRNDVVSEFYDLVNGESLFNIDLSNAFIRDYYYDNYAAAMHFNTEKSALTLETAIQSSHLNGDIIFEDQRIETDVFRVLPRVSWRYDFGGKKNIRFRYSTSINEPSLEQLQPNPDNSNPLNIYIGNPELVPEYRHSARINYFSYDQFSFRSFYMFFNLNYTKNNITNVTSFDENFVQTTTPVNVDYSLNLSGSQEFNTPIKLFNLRVSLRNRIGYTNSIIFVNDRESGLQRVNGNVRLRFENRNKQKWDWNFGAAYGYNVNLYSDEGTRNINYSNQNVFAELSYNHKNSFAISSGIDVNFYSEEQFGAQQTIPIWRASISKFILKDQRGEIKLSGFDLLNQNLGISRVENQNFVESSEIVSLARYFMFSFTYSFKPLSGKSKGSK